eukprot:scaffold1489_cov21-Tisochrysis_lutea.AAC.1
MLQRTCAGPQAPPGRTHAAAARVGTAAPAHTPQHVAARVQLWGQGRASGQRGTRKCDHSDQAHPGKRGGGCQECAVVIAWRPCSVAHIRANEAWGAWLQGIDLTVGHLVVVWPAFPVWAAAHLPCVPFFGAMAGLIMRRLIACEGLTLVAFG